MMTGEQVTNSDSYKPDFRFAPADWQSTICFPDDPHKTLVGNMGDLRYEHAGVNQDFHAFGCVISFDLVNADPCRFRSQRMDAPGIPVINTLLASSRGTLELVAFASRREGEGRIDNVLISTSRNASAEYALPRIHITSQVPCTLAGEEEGAFRLKTMYYDGVPRLWSNREIELHREGDATLITPRNWSAPDEREGSWFIRWCCEPLPGLVQPDMDHVSLLEEARRYWKHWKAFQSSVNWALPSVETGFLVSSSRNIQQSREKKGERVLFQVGPTVYRGLWLVDGYFLLEAARYLGFDHEAGVGLDALWELQQPDGGFRSGAGEGHWKDTAAALLTLARQSELAQDWSSLKQRWPAALSAVGYLIRLREKGLVEGTLNGKLGLLPPGFGDSGIGGIRNELANTLWTLIGLKGLLTVGERLKLNDVRRVASFYRDLYRAFLAAADREMRTHPEGFAYLPLLLGEDPGWRNEDASKQILPQAAQIYISHAIHPGFIFPADHPIAKGHTRLLRTILKEEIPCCTGWLRKDAVWPYSAAIFAGAMLASGERYFARSLFQGFLQHASPLQTWREEQSLQGIDPPLFIGDMPHNWASAECVRFLRHMLVLEHSSSLWLAPGLLPSDAGERQSLGVTATPTAWGRITCMIEPSGSSDWALKFRRTDFDPVNAAPLQSIVLPSRLFECCRLDGIRGAHWKRVHDAVQVDPEPLEWTAQWKSE